jgi:hypothetical protein
MNIYTCIYLFICGYMHIFIWITDIYTCLILDLKNHFFNFSYFYFEYLYELLEGNKRMKKIEI